VCIYICTYFKNKEETEKKEIVKIYEENS